MLWPCSLISLLLLQFSSTAHIDGYISYKNYKYYEVTGNENSVKELIHFFLKNFDVQSGNTKDNIGHIILAPNLAPIFETFAKGKGLVTKILINDYSKVIESEKENLLGGLDFSWTAYHQIDEINDYLHNMSHTYADSAQVIVGGKSFEGRKILGLRINTPSSKKKPVMFIESGIHAREWIAPAAVTYFINQLLTSNDKSIKDLKDNYEWHIFPSVNPDGYKFSWTHDRFWRQTRSKHPSSKCIGVDPNRNWDYNWGQFDSSHDPCNGMTYCGRKPFSEIETKTLSEYISSLGNLRGYIGFHSYAQVLLMPFSDSINHIDNYDDLKKIGQTSLAYGYKVNKEKYQGPGTAAEILYKASGGSMDWVRHVLKTPLVFTFELRGSNFHWPKERIPEQGEEVTQMLLGLATAAREMGYFD